jgi:ribosome-binding factor A
MDRVASLIREEVSIIIQRELTQPGFGFITVTEVKVTPDLKIAKVYVSILGNVGIREKTLTMLEDKKGFIRSLLGGHIRLKFTPAIHFHLDDTLDRVERINDLIKKTHDNGPSSGEGCDTK